MNSNVKLPGEPVDRDNNPINDSELIRDTRGKIIIFPDNISSRAVSNCAEVISGIIGREVAPVDFKTEARNKYGLHYAHEHALALYPAKLYDPPTLLQRAQIEALALYHMRYKSGLKIDEPLLLPRILLDVPDYEAEERLTVFKDEVKAYQLADIIERAFYRNASVITTPHGWMVEIEPNDSNDSNEMNAEELLKLVGVCRLLQEYDFVPSETTNGYLDEITPDPEARKARTESCKNANQTGAILMSESSSIIPLRPCNGIMSRLDEILLALKRLEVKTALAIEPAGMGQSSMA